MFYLQRFIRTFTILISIIILFYGSTWASNNENPYFLIEYSFEILTGYGICDNARDLNSNEDDRQSYPFVGYDAGLELIHSDIYSIFLRAWLRGPAHYGAPVWRAEKVETLFSDVKPYSFRELFPDLKEVWLNTRLFSHNINMKVGKFAYNIENSYPFSSKYSNIGIMFYGNYKEISWSLGYYRLDWNNRSGWGPSRPQENAFKWGGTRVDYWFGSLKLDLEKIKIVHYNSLLTDNSRGEDFLSFMNYKIKKDLLGLYGILISADIGAVKSYSSTFILEYAGNFGHAETLEDYPKRISHQGYFLRAQVYSYLNSLTISCQGILASGNELSNEEYEDGYWRRSANRAFSIYSPFNFNLFDTRYPKILWPIVASGSGFLLNYGIPRPGTFQDPHLFENIKALNVSFSFLLQHNIHIIFDVWSLYSFERGKGISDGEVIELPSSLGKEFDLIGIIPLSERLTLLFLSGFFQPERYYKIVREDDNFFGMFPSLGYDGMNDPAIQCELVLKWRINKIK